MRGATCLGSAEQRACDRREISRWFNLALLRLEDWDVGHFLVAWHAVIVLAIRKMCVLDALDSCLG